MEPLSNFSLNTNQNEISQIKQKVTKIEAICDIFWHSQIQGVEYFGQLGQDIIAYMMLKNVKNGFYCDIAAHNGKDINNTLLFERLGWMGFCVEANPKTFKELRKNRKCDCYNVAVMSKPMGKLRFATTTCDVLDCVELNLTEAHKRRIESHSEITYIEVDSTSFNEIMQNYKDVRHIDFLSLDVEGGEMEVLRGIDFSKFSFSLITIEHNYFDDAKAQITEFLASKGYRMLMLNGWDFMFIRDDKIRFGW